MASDYVTQRTEDGPAPPEGRSVPAAPYEGGLNEGGVVKPVPPPGRSLEAEEEERYESPVEGYVPEQRRLHWIVAALVVVQLIVGISIGATPLVPENQAVLARLFAVHGGTGTLIFVLMLVRLQLRRRLGAPPPPPGTPDEAALLARLNHLGFYVLLLALPVLGWFTLGAAGFPLSLFGIVHLPSPIAADPGTATVLGRMHGGLAFLLALGIVAHLCGVAYHTYVRQDGLLRRMWL